MSTNNKKKKKQRDVDTPESTAGSERGGLFGEETHYLDFWSSTEITFRECMVWLKSLMCLVVFWNRDYLLSLLYRLVRSLRSTVVSIYLISSSKTISITIFIVLFTLRYFFTRRTAIVLNFISNVFHLLKLPQGSRFRSFNGVKDVVLSLVSTASDWFDKTRSAIKCVYRYVIFFLGLLSAVSQPLFYVSGTIVYMDKDLSPLQLLRHFNLDYLNLFDLVDQTKKDIHSAEYEECTCNMK